MFEEETAHEIARAEGEGLPPPKAADPIRYFKMIPDFDECPYDYRFGEGKATLHHVDGGITESTTSIDTILSGLGKGYREVDVHGEAISQAPCQPDQTDIPDLSFVTVARSPEQCEVLERIVAERKRQDQKWGINDDTEPRWFLVLGEEVGEVANALLEMGFGKATEEDLEKEIVQVAAVATKWLEARLRRKALTA